MAANKKKLGMIGFIVVCLVLAAAITYKKEADYKKEISRPGGIETIDPNDMIWVKCSNADCETEYQMGKRDYFEYLQANQPSPEEFIAMMTDPNRTPTAILVCRDCEQKTAFRAEKCDKCSIVFMRGSFRHDFADRCPECRYSVTEDRRKEARKARAETDD